MRHVTYLLSLLFYYNFYMTMEPGGDDLQDDLVIDKSIASEEEDESSPLIPGITQDSEESEDDRVALSNAAESALLLAKKRKRKAKDKERKAKVRSCEEHILYTHRL